MKIYIDRNSGTWGAAQDLRILDTDDILFSAIDPVEFLDGLSDAGRTAFALQYGKVISTLLAQSYRKGYHAALQETAIEIEVEQD